MSTRRLVFATVLLATATGFFALGTIHTRRTDAALRASYDAKLDAIRHELAKADHESALEPTATSGRVSKPREAALSPAARA